MAGLSDAAILRRVQRGERNLYVELFDRYYGHVKRYACSQMADAADDLASETFVCAYRNVASCSLDKISYLGYLLSICRRLVLKQHACLPGVRTYELKENEDTGCGDTTNRLFLPRPKEIRNSAVRDALQFLPAEDREVIYLAYEAGLSRQDIMTILDQSSFSVFTEHLYRAMQKLNSLVKRQFPDDQEADLVH